MKTKLLLLLFLMNGWAMLISAKPIGKKEIPQKVYTTKSLKGSPPVIDGKDNDPAWQQVEWASDFINVNLMKMQLLQKKQLLRFFMIITMFMY